jgi:hypothetical protein
MVRSSPPDNGSRGLLERRPVIGYDTVLRARRLVTAAGETSGCVGVTDGRIAAVAPLEAGL